jgi:hypothetical protein
VLLASHEWLTVSALGPRIRPLSTLNPNLRIRFFSAEKSFVNRQTNGKFRAAIQA